MPPDSTSHASVDLQTATPPETPLQPLFRSFAAIKPFFWLAPLLGGLMLLVHFWRVGYLPALSFAELGVVLGAFGLFVAVGAGVFLVLLLLPAAAILHWTAHALLPAPPKGSEQPVLRRRRSLSRRPLPVVEPDASPQKRRTFSARMQPGGFGMFWVASAAAVALTFVALLWVSPLLAPKWQPRPVVWLLYAGLFMVTAIQILVEIGMSPRRLRWWRGRGGQFCLLFALNLLLWPIWLSMLMVFEALPQSLSGWLLFALLALFLLPWTHWIWYATVRAPKAVGFKVRVVTSVFVLAYAGVWQPLLDGAASTFGFGMMRGADLVLTERGCAIVQATLPVQRCAAVAPSPSPAPAVAGGGARPVSTVEAPLYRLNDVNVLTRIGAEYVIAPPGGIDDRTQPRVTLPAGEVLALVRRAKTP